MRVTAVIAAPVLKCVAQFRSLITSENPLSTYLESDDSERVNLMSAFSESESVDRELVSVLMVRLRRAITFDASEGAVVKGLEVGEDESRILTIDEANSMSLDSAAVERNAETYTLVRVVEQIALNDSAVIA